MLKKFYLTVNHGDYTLLKFILRNKYSCVYPFRKKNFGGILLLG